MSSETNCDSPGGKRRKCGPFIKPIDQFEIEYSGNTSKYTLDEGLSDFFQFQHFGNSWESPLDEGQSERLKKFHVIRDFPEGCGPFFKPIDQSKIEYSGNASKYTLDEGSSDFLHFQYFGNFWESPLDGQSERLKKFHIIRDFHEGCGPFIKPVDQSKIEYSGTAEYTLDEGGSDFFQSQYFGKSWESPLDEGQSEFAEWEFQYLENAWESPLQDGQSDFAQSELQCVDNSELSQVEDNFDQLELQCVDHSEVSQVEDNFDQSELQCVDNSEVSEVEDNFAQLESRIIEDLETWEQRIVGVRSRRRRRQL